MTKIVLVSKVEGRALYFKKYKKRCWKCDKPLKENEYVASTGSTRQGSKYRCLKCAVVLGLIEESERIKYEQYEQTATITA